MADDRQQTTLRLPAPLLKKLKLLAVQEDTTLTALFEEGVRRVLDARKGQRKEAR